MPDPGQSEVTVLLAAAGGGDSAALEKASRLVHAELRELASRVLSGEKRGQTLRTTALVNEAFARLIGADRVFEGRSHFFALAATSMRSILVDYARARLALKRGGDWQRVPLDDVMDSIEVDRVDLLALEDALTKLGELSPRQTQVVELRFFGGLSIEQTSDVLGVSHGTVENDWRFARAWLHREMQGGAP